MLDRVGGAPETGTGPRRVAAFSANFTDDARGDIEASYQQGIEALKVDPNNPEVLGRVEEFMKGYLESGIPLDKFKPGSPDARRVSANLQANDVRTAKDLSSMSRPDVIEAAAMLWANLPAAQRTPDNMAKFQNLAVTGDPTKSGYAVAAEGTARSIDAQNANTNYIKAVTASRNANAVDYNELDSATEKQLSKLADSTRALDDAMLVNEKTKWKESRERLGRELNLSIAALRRNSRFQKDAKKALIIRRELNNALPAYLAMLNNEFKSASLASPTTWFNYWFSDTVDPARLGGIADSIRIIRPDKNKPNKVSEIQFYDPSGEKFAGSLKFSELASQISPNILDPFIAAIDYLEETKNQAQVQE